MVAVMSPARHETVNPLVCWCLQPKVAGGGGGYKLASEADVAVIRKMVGVITLGIKDGGERSLLSYWKNSW